jgi:hypothetical protein
MAGRPNSRIRQQQVHHPLPAVQYQGLSERQRIERLTGWSLDRTEEILYPTVTEILAQPQAAILLQAQLQCIRAVWNVMVKSGLDNKRLDMEREKILADLTKREFGQVLEPDEEP